MSSTPIGSPSLPIAQSIVDAMPDLDGRGGIGESTY
jgi:hypothetical protein